MRLRVFCSRNRKEMLRDPLTMAFGLGFPLVLLLLLSAIQANIPVSLFEIESLAPGVAVFGLSFIALFSGLLIARDRESALMLRLFTSPMTAVDFILGYTFPLLPLALAQMAVCFACSFFLGLSPTVRAAAVLAVELPAAVVFIALGLLCGSLFTDRQVGGVCGALLTNGCAWLSGTWFDLELVGGTFLKVAKALPFVHAVDAGRAALAGRWADVWPDLWWVIGYAAALTALAVLVFTRKMKERG